MLTIGGGVFVRENNVIVGWIYFIEDSRGIAADAAHEIVSRGGDGGGGVAPREGGRNTEGWIEKNAISFFELWENVLALRLLLDEA